ncbi:MAG: hypothetical protein VX113_09870, partial [Pseudomonadota bacterium]|nr:hypothetical protein [Pseudomonadota bacterium]
CFAVPSALLWRAGALPADVSITDGFYAITRETDLLALDDLTKSNKGTEVLVVDESTDPAFAAFVLEAAELVTNSTGAGTSVAEAAAARHGSQQRLVSARGHEVEPARDVPDGRRRARVPQRPVLDGRERAARAAQPRALEHEQPLLEVNDRRADERVAALEDVEAVEHR